MSIGSWPRAWPSRSRKHTLPGGNRAAGHDAKEMDMQPDPWENCDCDDATLEAFCGPCDNDDATEGETCDCDGTK
jgi:hypothetical protein